MVKHTHIYKKTTIGENRNMCNTLFPHQIEILNSFREGKRYLIAGCRLGKTRPAIEFLRDTKNVLVLTKKAAIRGWESELEAMGVEGWTVCNYEKVRTKNWDMGAEWGALVLDEAHAISRYAKPNLCVKAIYSMKVLGPRIALSATPCAESVSQMFHQVKALRLPLWREHKNFYSWHKQYGIPDTIRAHGRTIETYKKTKPEAWEEVLPFCCYIDRAKAAPNFIEAQGQKVEIEAPEVLDLCKDLKRDMILDIGGRKILAETPLALAQKSQQIAAGAVLDDEGVAVQIHTKKLDWIKKQFSERPISILTQFKAEIDIILQNAPNSITEDFETFKNGEALWFVGTVSRWNAGVDLSRSEALVITGCPWSSVQFQQSQDRLLRHDRTMTAPVYYPVIEGGIDSMIYDVVAVDKRDFSARLFSHFR